VSYQPEEYGSYLHEQNYKLLSSIPYLWGTTVWAFADFGSARRNEGDVLGVNTKGLVSFDRETRKDPFFFYKANWSREPVTYLTSRRYTDRAYPVTDVKVYSNADSVTLSVNGAAVASMVAAACEFRTCVFKDVSLSPGVNTVSAVGDHGGKPVTDSVEWTLSTSDINIAAGRLATGYVSTRGTRFGSDDFFVGGDWGYIEGEDEDPRGGAPEDIIRTNDPELYKYFRRGEFSYVIPLADGSYELTLGFIEPDEDIEVGDRVFDVLANGEPLIQDLDIVDEAGGDREVITETFTVDVSGGQLVLDFTPSEGEEALVSTIKVASSEEPLR
jgi:beta-galactosidase